MTECRQQGVQQADPPTAAVSKAFEPVHLRRSDQNERFVAFAFAGSEFVVETDSGGCITYAAGAIRSRFGCVAESLVGTPLLGLVAPADQEALQTAVSLLLGRGRLAPILMRIADEGRSRLSLAGIVLPAAGRPLRLCFSFARPPVPVASVSRVSTPHTLARATEARVRSGQSSDLGFLELVCDPKTLVSRGDVIGHVLEAVMPEALASEVAPGRFGLLGVSCDAAELTSAGQRLEAKLQGQGIDARVATRSVSLKSPDLTPTQVTRALRHAISVFAREGQAGLNKVGYDDGLPGYIRRAESQAILLRDAIRSKDFTLAFQPIVSLANRETHHFEALIRPRHLDAYSFAGPQDFVMAVEALGLADELDLAVARLACEAAARTGLQVAFNLSGQSVQSPAFRDRLVALLTTNPARMRGLVLVEMTETAEIENESQACQTADALRALNVPFCLDDFGAGAADIRLLRSLSPDIVKIDGSYISGLTEGGREYAFLAGMIEIARASRAEIVAERVETEAEAEALRGLGIHYGQGWLFGKAGMLPVA